jgi:ribosomal-protein-alanine N-acetyltransferase
VIQIQPFGWWDIPAVHALELELFPTSPWSEAQFWGELAAEHRLLLVAKDEDQVIGYAAINIGDLEAEIMTIAVHPEHQRQGLGSAFMRAMLQPVEAAGVRHVLLEVEVGNDAAVTLYERFGFIRNGVRPNYYGLGSDAMLMERHV